MKEITTVGVDQHRKVLRVALPVARVPKQHDLSPDYVAHRISGISLRTQCEYSLGAQRAIPP